MKIKFTSTLIITFLFTTIALFGQTDTLDTNVENKKYGTSISGGFQLEVLSLSGFAHFGVRPKLSLGISFNFGINATNLILVAGENFSRESTINYDKTGERPRFFFETYGVSIYANSRITKGFDLSAGYKFTTTVIQHELSEDGDGLEGTFRGFFLQPSFGHGKFQYAFRLMGGQLAADRRFPQRPELKEFVILFQPLIFTLHFGRKKF